MTQRKRQTNPLYFDDAAKPMGGEWANPNSVHSCGRLAFRALGDARDQVRLALGLSNDTKVIFNSGATEGNTQVVEGVALRSHASSGIKPRLVLSGGSHVSVFGPAKRLSEDGLARCTVVDLLPNGNEDLRGLLAAIEDGATLCSIPLANNETGVVFSHLDQLFSICREKRCILHVDLAAAVGKIHLYYLTSSFDIATMSAAKFGGPEEFGILTHLPDVALRSLIPGGRSGRGGTPSVARAIQCADALEKAMRSETKNAKKTASLRDYFERELQSIFGERTFIFGRDVITRLPNISFWAIDGLFAMHSYLYDADVCFSTGAGCMVFGASSHVLQSMGVDKCLASSAVRLSFSPHNTKEEVKTLLRLLTNIQ